MTFDSITFDDRPFYQRIGYKLGSRPITMTHEKPANAPARITAPTNDSELEAVRAQPGRNFVEQGIALLSSRNPAFAALDHGEKCFRAGAYVKQLLAGKTVAPAAAPTPADQAARILSEIKKMPGADLTKQAIAYCTGKSVVALTSVSPELQPQAATAIIAHLIAGNPVDFAGLSADTSGTSQLASMPTTVDALVKHLNAQPGRNPVEKSIALLASRDASFGVLPWAEQVRRGGEISRALMAGRMPAGFGV